MRIYTGRFILALICFLFLSCNKNKSNIDNQENIVVEEEPKSEIKSLTALYYNYIFQSDIALKPEDLKRDIPNFDINRKGILDAQVTDSAKLVKIKCLLDSLKPSSEQIPLDIRIVAIINYDNTMKDTLCIGGEYSNEIYLNGQEMQTNNELIYTLKNYIGFYPWMIGDDMFQMTEIKDNSFPKEPFISTGYYKEYQKILADK